MQVVDHARITQRLRGAVQPRIARGVDGVEVGVGLGRHIVLQHRVVEDVAQIAHAVDAFELVSQLGDLLNLILDLGHIVQDLEDGLNEVGDVHHGNALRSGVADTQSAGDEASGSGEFETRLHVTLLRLVDD